MPKSCATAALIAKGKAAHQLIVSVSPSFAMRHIRRLGKYGD
jgi:hypothetical protein